MQYQQAIRLGMLHRQLQIPAKARIVLKILTDGRVGAYIWNLETGKTYTVTQENGNTSIRLDQRYVPQDVKDIIAANDDELKERWLYTMRWDEVRETVFSELAFRGIDMLKLEGIG